MIFLLQNLLCTHLGVPTLKPSPATIGNARHKVQISVNWTYIVGKKLNENNESNECNVDRLMQTLLAEGLVSFPEVNVSQIFK